MKKLTHILNENNDQCSAGMEYSFRDFFSVSIIISLIGFLFYFVRGDHGSGDGAIHVVYATNLQLLGQLAFNPGEFSSGTSSPTWTALLAGLAFWFPGGEIFTAIEFMCVGIFALVATFVAHTFRTKVGTGVVYVIACLFFLMNIRALSNGLQWEDGLLSTLLFALLMCFVSTSVLPSVGKVFFLAGLAGVVIMTRVSDSIFVSLVACYFFAKNPEFCRRHLSVIVLATIFTAIIALLYFFWSYAYTGDFIPSSVEARYELTRNFYSAPESWLFDYLGATIFDPVKLIPVLVCVFLMGYLRKINHEFFFWIGLYILGTVILYYATQGFNFGRYTMASNVLAFWAVARYLTVASEGVDFPRYLFQFFVLGFTCVIGLAAYVQPGNGYNWKQIVLEDQCYFRNTNAANQTIMLHEVQNRWCLDDSITVISMDGITDRIMTPAISDPYLVPSILEENSVAFMELYAPLASRYFIGKSVIGRAANAIVLSGAAAYSEGRIIFSVVPGSDTGVDKKVLVRLTYRDVQEVNNEV